MYGMIWGRKWINLISELQNLQKELISLKKKS